MKNSKKGNSNKRSQPLKNEKLKDNQFIDKCSKCNFLLRQQSPRYYHNKCKNLLCYWCCYQSLKENMKSFKLKKQMTIQQQKNEHGVVMHCCKQVQRFVLQQIQSFISQNCPFDGKNCQDQQKMSYIYDLKIGKKCCQMFLDNFYSEDVNEKNFYARIRKNTQQKCLNCGHISVNTINNQKYDKNCPICDKCLDFNIKQEQQIQIQNRQKCCKCYRKQKGQLLKDKNRKVKNNQRLFYLIEFENKLYCYLCLYKEWVQGYHKYYRGQIFKTQLLTFSIVIQPLFKQNCLTCGIKIEDYLDKSKGKLSKVYQFFDQSIKMRNNIQTFVCVICEGNTTQNSLCYKSMKLFMSYLNQTNQEITKKLLNLMTIIQFRVRYTQNLQDLHNDLDDELQNPTNKIKQLKINNQIKDKHFENQKTNFSQQIEQIINISYQKSQNKNITNKNNKNNIKKQQLQQKIYQINDKTKQPKQQQIKNNKYFKAPDKVKAQVYQQIITQIYPKSYKQLQKQKANKKQSIINKKQQKDGNKTMIINKLNSKQIINERKSINKRTKSKQKPLSIKKEINLKKQKKQQFRPVNMQLNYFNQINLNKNKSLLLNNNSKNIQNKNINKTAQNNKFNRQNRNEQNRLKINDKNRLNYSDKDVKQKNQSQQSSPLTSSRIDFINSQQKEQSIKQKQNIQNINQINQTNQIHTRKQYFSISDKQQQNLHKQQVKQNKILISEIKQQQINIPNIQNTKNKFQQFNNYYKQLTNKYNTQNNQIQSNNTQIQQQKQGKVFEKKLSNKDQIIKQKQIKQNSLKNRNNSKTKNKQKSISKTPQQKQINRNKQKLIKDKKIQGQIYKPSINDSIKTSNGLQQKKRIQISNNAKSQDILDYNLPSQFIKNLRQTKQQQQKYKYMKQKDIQIENKNKIKINDQKQQLCSKINNNNERQYNLNNNNVKYQLTIQSSNNNNFQKKDIVNEKINQQVKTNNNNIDVKRQQIQEQQNWQDPNILIQQQQQKKQQYQEQQNNNKRNQVIKTSKQQCLSVSNSLSSLDDNQIVVNSSKQIQQLIHEQQTKSNQTNQHKQTSQINQININNNHTIQSKQQQHYQPNNQLQVKNQYILNQNYNPITNIITTNQLQQQKLKYFPLLNQNQNLQYKKSIHFQQQITQITSSINQSLPSLITSLKQQLQYNLFNTNINKSQPSNKSNYFNLQQNKIFLSCQNYNCTNKQQQFLFLQKYCSQCFNNLIFGISPNNNQFKNKQSDKQYNQINNIKLNTKFKKYKK